MVNEIILAKHYETEGHEFLDKRGPFSIVNVS